MKKTVHFFISEVLNLAVSYLAGYGASMLVTRFFVKRGIGNLWGLAAKREAVGKDTYEWLMFVSSYLIGLLVMVLVNQLIKKMIKQEE